VKSWEYHDLCEESLISPLHSMSDSPFYILNGLCSLRARLAKLKGVKVFENENLHHDHAAGKN